MTAASTSAVASFDPHASSYDAVAESAIGREFRRRVHAVLEPLIGAETTLLDLGCGTGIDLAWASERVATAHGVDPSAEMVALAAQQCASAANVTVEVSPGETVQLDEPVDMLVSNFGAINCMGPLDALGAQISNLVRPDGRAVLVTMPHRCPWELLLAAARRDRALWNRRGGEGADPSHPGLTIRYANANDLSDALPAFELEHCESLGLALPTFEQRHWFEDRGRLLRIGAAADRGLAALGGRLGWGDHLITVWRRR
ncbi:MAG: class I SAM-dependent methyltransferase [Actinomycetota bacterium]